MDLARGEREILQQKIDTLKEKKKKLEKALDAISDRKLKMAERDLEERLSNIVNRIVVFVRMMVVIIVVFFGITRVPCEAYYTFYALTYVIGAVQGLFLILSVAQVLCHRKHFKAFELGNGEPTNQNTLFTKLGLILKAFGEKMRAYYRTLSRRGVADGVTHPFIKPDEYRVEDTIPNSQESDLSRGKVTSVWYYLGLALAYIIVAGISGIWFSIVFGRYLFDLRCVKEGNLHCWQQHNCLCRVQPSVT